MYSIVAAYLALSLLEGVPGIDSIVWIYLSAW